MIYRLVDEAREKAEVETMVRKKYNAASRVVEEDGAGIRARAKVKRTKR